MYKIHSGEGIKLRRAVEQLEGEGLETSVTTAHTPDSSDLVERAHQTVATMLKNCLQKTKLPIQYP